MAESLWKYIERIVPVAVAVIFILAAAMNESNVNGYTLAFFLSIISGAVLSSNKKEYGSAVLKGLSNPMFGTVAVAIILASISGKLVSESGMINALSDILISLSVSPGLFAAMSFLFCCVLSMSTGTSVGTYMIAVPIFFPIGVQLGTPVLAMIGAIASGGLFGDNLAPISDTTIASAGTQCAEMSDVVRTRCRYSIPVAALCFIGFWIMGAASSSDAVIAAESVNRASLVMLAVPATIIILCLKKVDLIASLSFGILAGAILGLAFGIFDISDLVSYPGGFRVEGILVEAINGSASTVFMLIGAFMFLGLLEAVNAIGKIANTMERIAKGRRSAELAIMLAVGIGGAITGVCTVSMVALGPIVHKVGERLGIKRERCANLMDCGGLSLTALAPWTVHAVLPASLAQIAIPGLDVAPLSIAMHNLYPLLMSLLMFITIAIASKRNMQDGDSDIA